MFKMVLLIEENDVQN